MNVTLKDLSSDQIKELEPEIMSALLGNAEHITKTIKALRDYAKQFIKDGGDIPGWYLKDGSKVRNIKDNAAAVKLLLNSDIGITPTGLLDSTTLPPGVLTEAIAVKLDLSKKKAEEKLAEVLGDVLTYKQNDPSLKRAKKAAA